MFQIFIANRKKLANFSVLTLFLSILVLVPVNFAASVTTCTVTTSTIEGVRVDSITSLAECTYEIPSGFNNISLVAVGGGGSGGTDAGSGGGGGGVQIRTNLAISAGTSLTVDIGAGGAARTSSNLDGNNGEATVVSWPGNSVTAGAGQGGQRCNFGNSYCRANVGGDSGVGGGNGGKGPFHGYPFRTSVSNTSATLDFTRGETGTPFIIGNTTIRFGGGGGGAIGPYGPNGASGTLDSNAGLGGGGNGETSTVDNTVYVGSGVPNSGGGGGGGMGRSGAGGSGIVLIALLDLGDGSAVSTTCTQGSVTKTQSGREVILTYLAADSANGDCTLTVPNGVFSAHYLVVAGGGGGSSGGGGAGGAISSWRTIRENGTEISGNSSPLTLSPGASVAIRVGRGGAAGIGGNISCWGTCSGITHRTAGQGANSELGSITARGGGRGGQGIAGGTGTLAETQTATAGGSGGGAGFDVSTTTAAAENSQVVGATTYGSSGGTVSNSGGYRAGSGGGGGAGQGGAPRLIYFMGDSANTPTSTTASDRQSTLGGGGRGGAGIYSNIGSFSNIYSAYACGGGGGLNSNLGRADNGAPFSDITTVWTAGGKAGCYNGGQGSNRSTRRSNTASNSNTPSADFNGTSGVNGFGGGGGGTDPEDMSAGRGGDGVVILRLTLPDSRCPYNASTVVTVPLACTARLRITAGDTAASTKSNRTSAVAAAPISYGTDTTTVSIVTNVSGIDTQIEDNKIVVSVSSSTSTLIGGTYPITYRLTNGSLTSDSFLLVTVRDPGQRTQVRVPVDPRDKTVRIPRIVVGNVQAVQVCVSPRTNATYSSEISATLVSNSSGSLADSPSGTNLRIRGTSESITANIGFINLTTSDQRLIKSGVPLVLDINVSNTTTGGNGACDFGTDSTMTLFPLKLTHTRTLNVPLKNGRQP